MSPPSQAAIIPRNVQASLEALSGPLLPRQGSLLPRQGSEEVSLCLTGVGANRQTGLHLSGSQVSSVKNLLYYATYPPSKTLLPVQDLRRLAWQCAARAGPVAAAGMPEALRRAPAQSRHPP